MVGKKTTSICFYKIWAQFCCPKVDRPYTQILQHSLWEWKIWFLFINIFRTFSSCYWSKVTNTTTTRNSDFLPAKFAMWPCSMTIGRKTFQSQCIIPNRLSKKDQMSTVWVWVTFRDVTNSNGILEFMWWGFWSVQEAGKLHWHILLSLIGPSAERWIMTAIGDLEKVITWAPQNGKVFLTLKTLKLWKRE